MSGVVDLEKARLEIKAKKAFKNWDSQFKVSFGIWTRIEDIPDRLLEFLAEGEQKSAFYFYDLIMTLMGMGSGFDFETIDPADKISVIDIQLFILDRIRYEYMKRIGWLASYPGEEYSLTELITDFYDLAPDIQAKPAVLSESHPGYEEYISGNLFEKEAMVRKLIPEALKKISYRVD